VERRQTRNAVNSAWKRDHQTQNYNTIDQSSSNFGMRSIKSGKHLHTQSQLKGGFSSTKLTVDSTVSLKKSTTTRGEKINENPGPGQYEHKTLFPNGPKHVIQTKSKHDCLFLTKISQNVSPGPGKYNTRGPIEGS
jgi:hypothetical protein